MIARTVRVDVNRRGGWEIALSGERDPVTCGTLADAQRMALQCAIDRQPCNLVVLDAYHRVLRHQLVDHHVGAAAVAHPDDQRPERSATPTRGTGEPARAT